MCEVCVFDIYWISATGACPVDPFAGHSHTEQAAAFFPDTDEIRAARAQPFNEVRVIWHDDPGTVTLYDPVSGYVINYDENTGTAYMTGDVAKRYLQDLTDTRV